MTKEEYEKCVSRTMARPQDRTGLAWDQAIFALGLAGEAGEVADLLKKTVGHGHPLDRAKLVKELGDVAWYLTAIALAHGIGLDEIMSENDRKLRERYPEGFNCEASMKRTS